MDRASDFESEGQRFNSSRARHCSAIPRIARPHVLKPRQSPHLACLACGTRTKPRNGTVLFGRVPRPLYSRPRKAEAAQADTRKIQSLLETAQRQVETAQQVETTRQQLETTHALLVEAAGALVARQRP